MNDLLRLDNAPRDVKWSSRDGYYVDNLLLVDCDTLSDVISVLNEGSRNRKVGTTMLGSCPQNTPLPPLLWKLALTLHRGQSSSFFSC